MADQTPVPEVDTDPAARAELARREAAEGVVDQQSAVPAAAKTDPTKPDNK